MRLTALCVLILAILATQAHAQNLRACDDDETTAGMRRCLAKVRDQLETQLIHNLEEARQRALQPAALDTAQARWTAFRQSQCRAEASQFQGGSLQPVVFLSCWNQLTQARARYLARLFVEP